MDGTIKNYRRSVHTQNPKQAIVVVKGITSKAAASALLGKSVVWRTPSGKHVNGKVSALHGSKGAVRARFAKAIPGEAIGARVNIH